MKMFDGKTELYERRFHVKKIGDLFNLVNFVSFEFYINVFYYVLNVREL